MCNIQIDINKSVKKFDILLESYLLNYFSQKKNFFDKKFPIDRVHEPAPKRSIKPLAT